MGSLALVRDGDLIALDVAARTITLQVTGAGARPSSRRMATSPASLPAARRYRRSYAALYQRHVTQADEGADFDFLQGAELLPEPTIFDCHGTAQHLPRHALLKRERPIGGWFMSASPVVAELMANAGYDFLVIDIEHSTASTHDLQWPAAGLRGIADAGRGAYGSTTRRKSSLRSTSARCRSTSRWSTRWTRRWRWPAPAVIRHLATAALPACIAAAATTRSVTTSSASIRKSASSRQLETPQAMAAAMQIAGCLASMACSWGLVTWLWRWDTAANVMHPQVRELMTEVGGFCRRAGVPLGTVMPTPRPYRGRTRLATTLSLMPAISAC